MRLRTILGTGVGATRYHLVHHLIMARLHIELDERVECLGMDDRALNL